MHTPITEEIHYPGKESVSPFLRWPAILISYVFHPVFILLYATIFMVYVHPYLLSGFSNAAKIRTVFIVVQNAVFYPLFCIVLLKGLGFIDSIFLKTQKDRIIPYMACGIFFFWTFLLFKQQQVYPRILASFFLGVFLASSTALIANIYFKISMHTIGLGGCLGLFLVISNSNSMLMTGPLTILLLITGLVSTARLLITNHTPRDIYTGLFVGILAQMTAAYIML